MGGGPGFVLRCWACGPQTAWGCFGAEGELSWMSEEALISVSRRTKAGLLLFVEISGRDDVDAAFVSCKCGSEGAFSRFMAEFSEFLV